MFRGHSVILPSAGLYYYWERAARKSAQVTFCIILKRYIASSGAVAGQGAGARVRVGHVLGRGGSRILISFGV